jgi:hypothetical protein
MLVALSGRAATGEGDQIKKRVAGINASVVLFVGLTPIAAQAEPPFCAVSGKTYAQGHIVAGRQGEGWTGLGHKRGVLHRGLKGFPGC